MAFFFYKFFIAFHMNLPKLAEPLPLELLQSDLTLEYFGFDAQKLSRSLCYVLHDFVVIQRLKQMEATESAVGHHDSSLIVRDACLKRVRKKDECGK